MFTLPEASHTPCLERLDAVGWAEHLVVSAYGASVGVRTTEAGTFGAVLAGQLPPGARVRPVRRTLGGAAVDSLLSVVVGGDGPVRNVRRLHLLYRDGCRVARGSALDALRSPFETFLALDVATFSRPYLFVHAGVVAWRGRAAVLTGPSGSGKSTLVEALLRLGAEYLSDEFAVVDELGRAHPYERALSMRTEGGQVRTRVPAAATATAPVPVAALVCAPFSAEAGRWEPLPLSAGEAAMRLAANTIPIRVRRRFAFERVCRLAERAPVRLAGARADAAAAAETIIATLDTLADREDVPAHA